jgi:hypothetical protein
MRILWLIGTRVEGFRTTADPALVAESPVASDRLRVAIPARLLRAAGIASEFCALDDRLPLPDPAGYDAVVFGKFTTVRQHDAARAALWIRFFQAARSAGCRIVADVSDNPFSIESSRAELYRHLLDACDAMTVPTAAMAQAIHPVQAPALVVSDPYEGEFRPARFSPGVPLRILWFGHKANYPYLRQLGPELAALAAEHPIDVHVVSSGIPDVHDTIARVQSLYGSRFRLRYTEWSLQGTRDALAECDLVIIPSDPADPRKRGASPNRLTETLVAGRLPVAAPLESYLPFASSALVGADIVAGVRHALAHPSEISARIAAGQALVRARHAPEVVASQWRRALAG